MDTADGTVIVALQATLLEDSREVGDVGDVEDLGVHGLFMSIILIWGTTPPFALLVVDLVGL